MGSVVRVFGLRNGTRRKVDVLRGDVGGAADEGPATGSLGMGDKFSRTANGPTATCER